MKSGDMNEKDDALIALLRKNARISVSEMARQLSASRTAVQKRLEKLERNQVITGYSVALSKEYQDSQVRALVMLKFPPKERSNIEFKLSAMRQLSALYSISGAFDIAVIISAGSMAALDQLIDEIGCFAAVTETMSSIIMSTKIDR